MVRLLLIVALIVALFHALRWLRRASPARVAALRRIALWSLIGGLLLAALGGRLNPLFALFAAALPALKRALTLLRLLPMFQHLLRALGIGLGGAASADAARPTLRARYLEVTLDPGGGRMDGQVRAGPFAGQRLSQLHLAQLLRMLEFYRDGDRRSAAVLAAYLDREHAGWRASAAADTPGGPEPGASLTQADAWAVLGLTPGASAEQIRAAHRRLMQKFHPDRGGSDYLAARINAAKRLLLGD